MANADRLTGLDSSFLHLEGGAVHMHVAGCAVFEGPAPSHPELVAAVQSRLHLVPRYRQRLAFVPLAQGRPVWVDDPQFRLAFHLRHTALPKPGSDVQLRRLVGRIFSQPLDRSRPLWELWLVEGVSGGRFALLSKTHHALVDGVSGVDIATVLFDPSPDAAQPPPPRRPWTPRPVPTGPQLLADALLERATVPEELRRVARAALVRGPSQMVRRLGTQLAAAGALTWAGLDPAPKTPFNRRIGPHRRFTWVSTPLSDLRRVKARFGGTINDVVLSAVADALGAYLRLHDHDTAGVELRALVPVSTRTIEQRGALGNRVTAFYAPLPIGPMAASERLALISERTAVVKASGQAVGAEILAGLTGFAPPTIIAQAARLQARQRFFNLVVTNVPGPQHSLYLLGRRLEAVYPLVPLAQNTGLAVAVMSYDGTLSFGLSADYDLLADLELLADELRAALRSLVVAADAPPPRRRRSTRLRAVK